jgi:hypothetical protein
LDNTPVDVIDPVVNVEELDSVPNIFTFPTLDNTPVDVIDPVVNEEEDNVPAMFTAPVFVKVPIDVIDSHVTAPKKTAVVTVKVPNTFALQRTSKLLDMTVFLKTSNVPINFVALLTVKSLDRKVLFDTFKLHKLVVFETYSVPYIILLPTTDNSFDKIVLPMTDKLHNKLVSLITVNFPFNTVFSLTFNAARMSTFFNKYPGKLSQFADTSDPPCKFLELLLV